MTIFKKLPDDILNYLNNFVDIKSKVNLIYSKTNNQELIELCYIKRITNSYQNLTDEILKQNLFKSLIFELSSAFISINWLKIFCFNISSVKF